MKALVYEKPGRAHGAIREIPRPVCGDNQVLIKVMACGICKPAESSHDRSGSLLGKYPAVPGHEFAGIAEEVGKNVTNISVGDRVTADNGIPCGTCWFCQKGMPTMCENFRSQGHNLQGGFAEYIACDAAKVYRFSDKLTFDEACMSELIGCALNCVDSAQLRYGDNIVIVGCGSSGAILAQLFRHSCAGRVVVLDTMPAKLARAKAFGVETVLVDPEDYSKHELALSAMFPHGIDVIIDAAGDDQKMFESCVQMLAPKGRYVLYSFFYQEPKYVRVEPGLLIRKGLQIVGSPLQMFRFRDCLDVLEQKKVDAKALVTETYPLDRYFEALDRAMADPNTWKIVIHPQE